MSYMSRFRLSGSAFNVPDAFFQCQGPEVYNVYRRGSASVQFIFKKGSQDEGISACVGQVNNFNNESFKPCNRF